jgi:hypothetical protein
MNPISTLDIVRQHHFQLAADLEAYRSSDSRRLDHVGAGLGHGSDRRGR